MTLKWFFLSNRAVKLTFEKKNQKTNASINHLRKKLEKYHKAVLVSALLSSVPPFVCNCDFAVH